MTGSKYMMQACALEQVTAVLQHNKHNVAEILSCGSIPRHVSSQWFMLTLIDCHIIPCKVLP